MRSRPARRRRRSGRSTDECAPKRSRGETRRLSWRLTSTAPSMSPRGDDMRLVLMTAARQATTEVLPALGLLGHQVRVVAPELSSLLDGDSGDVVLVDARYDLIQARTLCGLRSATGVASALLAVLSEGGLVALSADWGVDDVLLDTAGPAEVDARLKWA